jgi:[ribosomal protein S5]-alanine N-acetyltransferase
MDYFLKTERLGFRNWTAADLPLALELWGDPKVTRLIGGPFAPDAVRSRLADEMRQFDEHGVQYWPVFLLENGGHAGCAGLRPYRIEQKIYEIGIHLRPAFWGLGYGEEAAHALIKYAFGDLKIHALLAGHHPDNAASRQLLQKLGFTYQGDQHYIPTGLMHPTYLMRANREPEKPGSAA